MNITGEIPLAQKAAYLRTLPAVRERCGQVFELAKAGKLDYFVYHPEKETVVTEFCAEIITVSTILSVCTDHPLQRFGIA